MGLVERFPGSSLGYERRSARRGKDVEFAGEEATGRRSVSVVPNRAFAADRDDARCASSNLRLRPIRHEHMRRLPARSSRARDHEGPPATGWAGKLAVSKRSQLMFMDRDGILNLFVVTNLPLPKGNRSHKRRSAVLIQGKGRQKDGSYSRV
jgi:hypothetical protein